MNGSRIIHLAVTSLLVTSVSTAADSLCVAPGENAIVQVKATSNQGMSPKVYFSADQSTVEHFVEMRRTNQTYEAVLPKVDDKVSRINYRVESGASRTLILGAGSIEVSEKCAKKSVSREEAALAESIIVGLTSEMPVVPQGFLCKGIVGSLNPAGELKAVRCHQPVGVQANANASAVLVQSGVAIDRNPPRSAGTNPPVSSARP